MAKTPTITTDHFTARIEVKEVRNSASDGGYNQPDVIERQVVEVSSLVLRADTLAKLQAKVAAHVALIEE